MPTCYLALGGNVGDVIGSMERGLDRLEQMPGVRVVDISPVYQTAPAGGGAGGAYLNAAVRLECACAPLILLGALQSIEDELGRNRRERWSPRPLDLDLLLFGGMVFHEPVLTVPHPYLWYRRFVLDPLVDIAAGFVHPVTGTSVRELLDRLLPRPLPVLLAGGDPGPRRVLSVHLSRLFPQALITDVSSGGVAAAQPALTLDLSASPEFTGEASPFTVRRFVESTLSRSIPLADLPGTPSQAAESVLTAALDQPIRHSRPLRRTP